MRNRASNSILKDYIAKDSDSYTKAVISDRFLGIASESLRKRGKQNMAHWNVDRTDTECKCSNCNKDFLDFVFSDDVCMNSEFQGYPKYCPNCGEKMDESVEKMVS